MKSIAGDEMQHNRKGIKRLIMACRWSFQGIRQAFMDEEAFRQEAVLAIILCPLGLWLGETGVEKSLLTGTVLLVLVVELLNSAIEATVDRIGMGLHPLSGRAKDMGSAAVFFTLLLAFLTWVSVLFF